MLASGDGESKRTSGIPCFWIRLSAVIWPTASTGSTAMHSGAPWRRFPGSCSAQLGRQSMAANSRPRPRLLAHVSGFQPERAHLCLPRRTRDVQLRDNNKPKRSCHFLVSSYSKIRMLTLSIQPCRCIKLSDLAHKYDGFIMKNCLIKQKTAPGVAFFAEFYSDKSWIDCKRFHD